MASLINALKTYFGKAIYAYWYGIKSFKSLVNNTAFNEYLQVFICTSVYNQQKKTMYKNVYVVPFLNYKWIPKKL